MKPKNNLIVIAITVTTLFFVLCFFVQQNQEITKLKSTIESTPQLTYFTTARLDQDSSNIKIFTSDVSDLGKLFIFTDLNNNTIDSLLVENYNIGPPTYEIIKGAKRDWLVVTTIEESGTGYIKEVDSWYTANNYFGPTQKVLSYVSKLGFYNPSEDTEETISNVILNDKSDESVAIEFITNKCSIKNKCARTSNKKTYILGK